MSIIAKTSPHAHPPATVAEHPGNDRRDRILRAAAKLFAEQGYLGTSTTQIAEAVGIRQPTLYHHFGSKAEILRTLLTDWLGAVPELAEELAGRRDVDAAARIYALLRSDLETLGRNPYDQRGLWAEHLLHDPQFAAEAARIERWLEAVMKIVRQGVQDRTFHPVEPPEVAYLVDGLFYGMARLARKMRDSDPSAQADRMAKLIVRGLLADVNRLEAACKDGRAICADLPVRPP